MGKTQSFQAWVELPGYSVRNARLLLTSSTAHWEEAFR